MKKQKPLSIKKQFQEAKSYLKKSTDYIYLTIGLFIFSIIMGIVFREQLAPFVNEILRDLIDRTEGLNTIEIIFFILQNNLLSGFIAMMLGAVLGIFPIFSSIINGLVIGYVMALSAEFAGIQSWWRLLPHGIFELPAIFISFGLGIAWGIRSTKNYFTIFKKNKKMINYGVLTIVLLLGGIILNSIAAVLTLLQTQEIITTILAGISSISVLTGALLYFVFFMFSSKKIINFQKDIFYKTMNVFLMIIIPLLIIAAIIEGLLIAFIS